MSAPKKELDLLAVSLMLLLCTLWGGQQSIVKLIANDMSPVLQISLRSAIGIALLSVFMWHQKISFALHRGPWQAGLVVGLLFTIEFWFIGEGLRLTSASHMVVFLYTAPIFTALGLHIFLPEERLSLMQWGGILVSFTGITIAFIGGFINQKIDANMLLGDILSLLAGLAWGLTTVVLRCTRLTTIPAAQTTLYQLITACIGLFIAATLMNQLKVNWTPAVITSVIAQGVLISFFALLVWFWLLKHYKASKLATFSFFTPITGVMFGVWLLNEPLHTYFIFGAAMVIFGVFIVNHPRARLKAKAIVCA
jgi:drug/metabolite transporter (DMT)-like permease